MRLGLLTNWLGGARQNDASSGSESCSYSSLDTVAGGATESWALWSLPADVAADASVAAGAAGLVGAPGREAGPAPSEAAAAAATPVAAAASGDPVSPDADIALGGAQATATYGVTGAGLKIGIISNSFNDLGGAAADEADGALPATANVHILQDGTGGDDEGRAMAQIVHSIAPGASIYFDTGGNSPSSMASAIAALQAQGCQIICSDLNFSVDGEESMFQEGGPLNNAIDAAVAAGTTYFTCATNYGPASAYQASFTPMTVTLPGLGTVTANNFGGGNAFEAVHVTGNLTNFLDLQWDQPWQSIDGHGAASSLGFYVFSYNGSSYVPMFGAMANEVGQNPAQTLAFTAPTSGTYYVAVVQNAGTSFTGQFKLEAENNSFSPVTLANANSGTLDGNAMDPNAIVVGAAPVTDPTVMEDFSSNTVSGPSAYLLNASGNPIAPADAGVSLTAVDGNGIANDTGVGANFYGTSAATPAAAAVGALVLQADPGLTPTDVQNLLEDSATTIGSAAAGGAGLINADLAVGYAESGTITATSGNDVLYGTHLGDTFVGGPGNHDFIGTGGVNTLDYVGAPGAVTVDFATGTASNGYGGCDQFSDIQDLIAPGVSGDQVTIGGAADPSVTVSSGSVTLAAGSSGTVTGNSDSISCGSGDVLTLSGTGNAVVMSGGSLDLAGGSTGSLVGSADTVTAAGNTNLTQVGNDSSTDVTGSGAVLAFNCQGDSVSISGGSIGFAEGDTATIAGNGNGISGASASLALAGNANTVMLDGGAITVTGGTGNRLVAGAGSTTLAGGSGGNSFAFTDGSGGATIVDFTASAGNVLDLSGVGAFHSLADVAAHWSQQGASVVITDPTSAATLTLQNTTTAYLQAHSGEIHL